MKITLDIDPAEAPAFFRHMAKFKPLKFKPYILTEREKELEGKFNAKWAAAELMSQP